MGEFVLMEPGDLYFNMISAAGDEIDIYEGPKAFLKSLEAVREEVGLLYAAYFCQFEVCNGGSTQFFWNSTGVLAPEAARGFEANGQVSVARVVEEAMAMMGSPYPRERRDRWAMLRGMNGAAEDGDKKYRNVALFDPLESRFHSLVEAENGGFEVAADRFAGLLGS